MPSDWAIAARVVLGFVLAYIVGFERELRGSPAGDRTFALVGTGTAAITALAVKSAPSAVAGAVTGIGFIGAGVVIHGQGDLVHGITTAAALYATAAIGLVVGSGHLLLGVLAAGLTVLALETRYLHGLDLFDARRYADKFRNDIDRPHDHGPGPPPPG